MKRATLRGDERTPLDERPDVLICGASFAGLAVARELAGSGADVLVVDRYEIGERATSACAAPTPWLHAMGVERAIRQEIPCMAFHTPHGSARFRLPWSWSSFDYRELCRALYEQTDARFEIAKVNGRSGDTVHTDRGDIDSPLIVDALGWRRVLGERTSSRRTPRSRAAWRSTRTAAAPTSTCGSTAASSVTATRGRCRRRASSASASAPTSRATTSRSRRRRSPSASSVEPVRYQGNWFPHRLRPAAEDGVFFVGDSAGHCLPLSGEGIRTAFYFGIAAGREIRAVLDGDDKAAALARYGAFSRKHAPTFAYALALQRLIPRLPPRALTALLSVMGREKPCRRAFDWYLEQAHPRIAVQ